MLALLLALTISISIKPQVCFEPCQIEVKLTFEDLHKGNQVCLAVSGVDFFTSSCFPHNGQKVRFITIKNIPVGLYEVILKATGAPTVKTRLEVRE